MTPEEKAQFKATHKVTVEAPKDIPVWGESCTLREGMKCWHYKNRSDECSTTRCPLGQVYDE